MNNSKIISGALKEELVVDVKPALRQRRQEVTEILEALGTITRSNHWGVLEQKVFSPAREGLGRKIRIEQDTQELFRLQGQFMWVDKYGDLTKLAESYRKELERINNQLNG